MSAFWKWLTGKKTYFATALLLIAQAGYAIAPQYSAVWDSLIQIATALGAVGIAHKVGRSMKPQTGGS